MRSRTRILGAIDVVEEALHLVRSAPSGLLGAYYAGSLPFILALLYFWADMSHNAFAYNRCASSALALALLFAWMKAWHAVYARGLLAFVQGETELRWSRRRILKMLVTQTTVHACGIVAIPCAFAAIIPFPWVYAFYQNLCVFGDGEAEMGSAVRRAWKQAGVWPQQNALVIWLLSPVLLVAIVFLILVVIPVVSVADEEWSQMTLQLYAFVVGLAVIPLNPLGVILALNLGILFAAIPELLETFLGIESVFSQGGSLFNTTTIAVICAMSYLLMDPVLKAAYVLRCYYGESLRTGADLKAGLRSAIAESKTLLSVVLVTLAVLAAGGAHGGELPQPPETKTATIAANELDQAIDHVIQGREYSWRLPRQKPPEDEAKGAFAYFMEDVGNMIRDTAKKVFNWIRAIFDWIREHWPKRSLSGSRRSVDWLTGVQGLAFVLLAVAICALAIFLIRLFRQRGARVASLEAEPVITPQDLEQENLTADALPEDRWLAMAQELMEQGEMRLALRALFLATLAFLSRVELVTIRMFKSNRDYQRELERRAHAYPALPQAFSRNVFMFEGVWYGAHDVTDDMIGEFKHNHEAMRESVGGDKPMANRASVAGPNAATASESTP